MTLLEWMKDIEQAFIREGIDQPRLEAKWLLSAALEQDASFITLNPDYVLTSAERDRLEDWLARRLKGEPLSRIKGVREFWSLPFHLNESTLDPRPDSETLIEAALEWIGDRKQRPWRILDLGTGSGCLLIALLHELPQAQGLGIDLSERALEMARSNADLNQVATRSTFQRGNWGESLEGEFDIIISNPPYIPLKDKGKLKLNVTDFDPELALFAGEDGLEAYRILAPQIKRLLAPQGFSVLEHGFGQSAPVRDIFADQGFKEFKVYHDIEDRERAIGFSN